MEKFFLICCTVFCSSIFFAADAAGVKKGEVSEAVKAEICEINTRFFRAWFSSDFNTVQSLVHPEFKGDFGDLEVDFQQVKFTARLYNCMEQLKSPDARLVDFVEFGMISKGLVMSDTQRKHFTELGNTPEGREMLKSMRQTIMDAEKELKKSAAEAEKIWRNLRFISCTGNAENVVLVMGVPSGNGYDELVSEWVKADGRWLVRKVKIKKGE